MGSKTKQHMTTEKRQTGGGVGEHKGLKPGKSFMYERARNEQVRGSLEGCTAERVRVNRVAEVNQAVSGVQNPVRHLPREIYDWAVQVKI